MVDSFEATTDSVVSAEDEIPYANVRQVRDETGASHEDCRHVLRETDGDVAAAIALWFARKRGTAPAPVTGTEAHPSSSRS